MSSYSDTVTLLKLKCPECDGITFRCHIADHDVWYYCKHCREFVRVAPSDIVTKITTSAEDLLLSYQNTRVTHPSY